MKPWDDLIGLVDRQNIEHRLWKIEHEPLFELDIFDSKAAEAVIKMIESSSDEAGGLHRLAIVANSRNQNNLFISSLSMLKWFM
jgi:tetrahydromethanopterin S-methyltransferase subunit H